MTSYRDGERYTYIWAASVFPVISAPGNTWGELGIYTASAIWALALLIGCTQSLCGKEKPFPSWLLLVVPFCHRSIHVLEVSTRFIPAALGTTRSTQGQAMVREQNGSGCIVFFLWFLPLLLLLSYIPIKEKVTGEIGLIWEGEKDFFFFKIKYPKRNSSYREKFTFCQKSVLARNSFHKLWPMFISVYSSSSRYFLAIFARDTFQ